jgi:hypothetical protein
MNSGDGESGPGRLTTAECRVAAIGHTNREIAAKLFVTASTVEQHLTRVYRRTKVISRRDCEPLSRMVSPRTDATPHVPERHGIRRGPAAYTVPFCQLLPSLVLVDEEKPTPSKTDWMIVLPVTVALLTAPVAPGMLEVPFPTLPIMMAGCWYWALPSEEVVSIRPLWAQYVCHAAVCAAVRRRWATTTT